MAATDGGRQKCCFERSPPECASSNRSLAPLAWPWPHWSTCPRKVGMYAFPFGFREPIPIILGGWAGEAELPLPTGDGDS
eukprot:6713471-Pyramimonas_sp.AAC.1